MYLSDKQLAVRFNVSKPCIWRWARETDFPKPVKLSPGCTRWRVVDIEKWEVSRGCLT